VRKRLCVVALSAIALLGLGLAPAKAASPPAPSKVNVSTPAACVHLYLLNLGYCQYRLPLP
jgi:hypothetical protein